MTVTICYVCKRALQEGESASASDWIVIGDDYRSVCRETRYTCDDCEVTA